MKSHSASPSTIHPGPRRGALAFDRADLTVFTALLAVTVLGTALLQVVLPAFRWASGGPLEASVAVPPWAENTAPSTAAGVTASGPDFVDVSIAGAPAALWIAELSMGTVLTAALVATGIPLWNLMRSVTSGQPFTDANFRRLRLIGWIMMIAPFPYMVAQGIAGIPVTNHVFPHSDGGATLAATFTMGAGWLLMAAGGLVMCLAEAFRRGLQLERDTEGLV